MSQEQVAQPQLVQGGLGIDTPATAPGSENGTGVKPDAAKGAEPTNQVENPFAPAPASKEKLVEEYGTVGEQILGNAIKRAQNEQETAKKAGKNAPEVPPERQRAIQALGDLDLISTREGNQVNPKAPLGIRIEGDPLDITINGQEYQIRYIRSFNGDTVNCVSVNGGPDIPIPRQALRLAYIASEQTAIIGYLPTTERAALNGYVDIEKAKAAGKTPTIPETSRQDIETAAVTVGRVRSTSVATAIETAHKNGAIDEATAKNLIGLVNGTTVATPEAVGSVVHTLNNLPATITELEGQRSPITNEIENKKQLLNMATSDQERARYSQEIVNLESQLHRLELTIANLRSLPQTEEDVQAMFRQIYSGEFPLANPSQVDNIIREGANVNELHKLVDESKLTEEEKDKYSELLKYAKMGGIGLIAILALMLMRATGEK